MNTCKCSFSRNLAFLNVRYEMLNVNMELNMCVNDEESHLASCFLSPSNRAIHWTIIVRSVDISLKNQHLKRISLHVLNIIHPLHLTYLIDLAVLCWKRRRSKSDIELRLFTSGHGQSFNLMNIAPALVPYPTSHLLDTLSTCLSLWSTRHTRSSFILQMAGAT